jgi:hypothetical protein
MWLYLPSECSRSSPAAAVSTQDSSERFRALARSVTWSGNSVEPRRLSAVWRRANWTKLLSGATSEPSMVERGAALWIASWRDSPARPSVSRETVAASRMSAGSGLMSTGWLTKRERGWWLSRTFRGLFQPIGNSETYSEAWPTCGSMRSGYVYRRAPWAPAKSASAGSAWPTATSGDSNSSGSRTLPGSAAHPGTSLTDAVKRWPSARAEDSESDQAAQWMTPQSPTGGRTVSDDLVLSKGASPTGKRTVGLESQTRMWTTPQAHDTAPGDASRVGRFGTKHGGRNLTDDVARWTMPSANLFNDGESPEMFEARRQRMLAKGYNGNGTQTPLPIQAAGCSHRDQTSATNGATSSQPTRSRSRLIQIATSGRRPYRQLAQRAIRRLTPRGPEAARLNAWFVEWLMGWPRGSTVIDERVSASSATASSPNRQPRRSASSRAG